MNRNLSILDLPTGHSHRERRSPHDVDETLDKLRTFYAELDQVTSAVVRQAGLSTTPDEVDITESAWKADDAAWFEHNPTRSHRLRPVLPGEAESVRKSKSHLEPPANHHMEILVRQVQPGHRLRLAFYRHVDAVIPDAEEIIHAIFDLVSNPEKQGAIRPQDVLALATKYKTPMANRPH